MLSDRLIAGSPSGFHALGRSQLSKHTGGVGRVEYRHATRCVAPGRVVENDECEWFCWPRRPALSCLVHRPAARAVFSTAVGIAPRSRAVPSPSAHRIGFVAPIRRPARVGGADRG